MRTPPPFICSTKGAPGNRAGRRARAVLGAAVAVCLGAAPAQAANAPQLSGAFPIDHADPEGSVPGIEERNKKPVEFGYYLQDLASFALMARRSGNRSLEARYYLALAKAVPDRSAGFSKACEALESAGKRDEAVGACRSALGLDGVELKDYVRFVHLMLAKPHPLTATEKDELAHTVDHLQRDPQARVAGLHLQCEIALHVEDFATLATCSRALERLAPNDTKTITFLWALAAHDGNRTDAEILIARARSHGIAPAVVARMESATSAMKWRRWLPGIPALWAAAAIVVVALVTGSAILLTRRVRRDRHQSVAGARP
jgi:hypothetical protein